MDIFEYHAGSAPVIVSMPHTATGVPEPILARFTDAAKRLPDTDWHIARLWDFARDMGAHVLKPLYSRYVIDLNRGPDDASLYQGQFTTGLCPTPLFDGKPLYLRGQEPDAAEVEERLEMYWKPYHLQLASVLFTLGQKHTRIVLVDAHSIRSQVPTLFTGTLPDLNLGTANGSSASAELCGQLEKVCAESSYSSVHNGRFKGGYITRHYGSPGIDVHAVQLELAQKNYMHESYPFAYDEQKAASLQATLRNFLGTITRWVA